MTRVLLSSSGLLLVFFLIIHLGGLLFALLSPIGFEIYATDLHSASWLRLIEVVLIIALLVHVSLTITKVVKNNQVGNSANLVSRRNDLFAAFAARTQPIGGILIFFFLLIHLAELRFPRPENGTELSTLREVLNSPTPILIYLVGSVSVSLHVLHGIESAQRSLGLLTSDNAELIRLIGRGISLLLGFGFILVTALFQGFF